MLDVNEIMRRYEGEMASSEIEALIAEIERLRAERDEARRTARILFSNITWANTPREWLRDWPWLGE